MDRSLRPPYQEPTRRKGRPIAKSPMRYIRLFVISITVLASATCSQTVRRSGMPAGAQTVIDRSIDDIDAGRYEKLYQEAADEWRNESTLDQSKATFQKLRDKLGNVRTRDLQSTREEQTSTAPIRGHSVVVIYKSTFDRTTGNPPQPIRGMETFTLLEHGGQWYLARYFVNSDALR